MGCETAGLSGAFGFQQRREQAVGRAGGLGWAHKASSDPQVGSLCSSSTSGPSVTCHANCRVCVFLCNMSSMPLILIIHTVHVCKFTSLLKCVHNLKINTRSIFTVIHGHTQSGKKIWVPVAHVSRWVWTDFGLPSYFSSHAISKCPFWGLFSAPYA